MKEGRGEVRPEEVGEESEAAEEVENETVVFVGWNARSSVGERGGGCTAVGVVGMVIVGCVRGGGTRGTEEGGE